jgi:hypothetical protein
LTALCTDGFQHCHTWTKAKPQFLLNLILNKQLRYFLYYVIILCMTLKYAVASQINCGQNVTENLSSPVLAQHAFFFHGILLVVSIDLVLIDQHSMGKSLHLMDTVNAKKRWPHVDRTG